MRRPILKHRAVRRSNVARPRAFAAPVVAGQQRTLLETVVAGGFNTFASALEVAGLSESLRTTVPYTVFAPTDAAFEQLPPGCLDRLLGPHGRIELTAILRYHIVDGCRTSADLRRWKSAPTVNGRFAAIELSGQQILIDGARLTVADLAADNGMVHGIDKVNLPGTAPVSAAR